MELELKPVRVRFPGSGAFHRELKRRVDAYFEAENKSPRDAPRMFLKTAVILTVSFGSYFMMMLAPLAWWQYPIFAVTLAMGIAGIGVSIQHDANHGGYSSRKWVNNILKVLLDVVGASSYIWYWKHNIVHHTYTNVSGIDVDIDLQPYLKLAPDQPNRWYYKYQQYYIWVLYCLQPTNWQFYADYRDLINGDIGGMPIPRPRKRVLIATLFGKAFYYSWSLIIPLMLYPAWAVLPLYAITTCTLGLILTITFQLAHCVGEAEYVKSTDEMKMGWAEHQVRTTANFAPKGRFLTWYLGGLNYQIEHHLFPKVCHVHYPAISPIVAETCRDFDIPYNSHPTLREALASHLRWLRTLGTV